MKGAKFNYNDRVDFKDEDSQFHVGYVKSAKRVRKGLFRKVWVYNICEFVKGATVRKVYIVPENCIFGIVEQRKKAAPKGKVFNDFKDLAELNQ